MSASELNRVLFELNQADPQLAAEAEKASVIAVCFASIAGCPEGVLLATRAAAVAEFVPGTNTELADQTALEATRSFLGGQVEGETARQVEALVHPLNLAELGQTAG